MDILTSDDNYVPSEIWRKKDVHVESDEEILATGVPKAITLYKSKIIERIITEQKAKLSDPNLDDSQLAEITMYLSRLNKAKVQLSKKLQRLIL